MDKFFYLVEYLQILNKLFFLLNDKGLEINWEFWALHRDMAEGFLSDTTPITFFYLAHII